MRLRRTNFSPETFKESHYFLENPESLYGKWENIFKNAGPKHLEIGMGKGNFIKTIAALRPEINFIGLEKSDKVLQRALKNFEKEDLTNLKVMMKNADDLEKIFMENEIDRIYLNFSDPWPKIRHSKRRLTSQDFLKIYEHILKKDGDIHLKTDNRAFFEYSIETFNNYGLIIRNINFDLHKSELNDNIETEYETKLKQFGPIYQLEAYFGRKTNE